MEELTCAELGVVDACLHAQTKGQACFDETAFPWNRIFVCAFANTRHNSVEAAGLWVLLFVVTFLVIWVSVGVLAKVRLLAGHQSPAAHGCIIAITIQTSVCFSSLFQRVCMRILPNSWEVLKLETCLQCMQIAEMYFAPALEDLCIRCHVPARTSAALFVALANGAPDLAAAANMFRAGACKARPRTVQPCDTSTPCIMRALK
jgi:hypothetical protein